MMKPSDPKSAEIRPPGSLFLIVSFQSASHNSPSEVDRVRHATLFSHDGSKLINLKPCSSRFLSHMCLNQRGSPTAHGDETQVFQTLAVPPCPGKKTRFPCNCSLCFHWDFCIVGKFLFHHLDTSQVGLELGSKYCLLSDVTGSIRLPQPFGIHPFTFQGNLHQRFPCLAHLPFYLRNIVLQGQHALEDGLLIFLKSSDSELLLPFYDFQQSALHLLHVLDGLFSFSSFAHSPHHVHRGPHQGLGSFRSLRTCCIPSFRAYPSMEKMLISYVQEKV